MAHPRLSVPPAVLNKIRNLAADGLPRRKIADAVGLSLPQVEKLCLRNNIQGLPSGYNIFVPSAAEERKFRDLIEVQKMQHYKAAKLMGWSKKRTMRTCHRLKLNTQRTGPRSGEGHPDWSGGRIVDKDGYVLIYSPSHPHGSGSRGMYVREHRLVMEKHLGRYLKRSEVVHHKDGNHKNNQIQNLELFATNGDHLRHELTGKCPKWTPAGKAKILRGVRKAGRNPPWTPARHALVKQRRIARLKASNG